MWYGLTLRLILNKYLLQEHKGYSSELFVAQGDNFQLLFKCSLR